MNANPSATYRTIMPPSSGATYMLKNMPRMMEIKNQRDDLAQLTGAEGSQSDKIFQYVDLEGFIDNVS